MKKLASLFLIFATFLSSCSLNKSNAYDKSLSLYFQMDEKDNGYLVDKKHKVSKAKISNHFDNSLTLLESNSINYKVGIKNDAVLFDGYSTYASFSSDEYRFQGQELSISVWLAPRSYNYTDQNDDDISTVQGIISQYFKDDSFSMGVSLGYKREGKVYFGVGTNNGWYQLDNNHQSLNQYQWNNIFVKFDGINGEMAMFINGLIVNRMDIKKGSNIEACDLPLLVGKNSTTSSSGDCSLGVASGLIDELRVYSKALTYNTYKQYYKSCLDSEGNIPSVSFNDVYLQNSLTNDAYKPQYHAGPYEHWMNEPHAPIYYKGVYHIFYQCNSNGPYFNDAKGITWGHLTSLDMVNWTPQKEVIVFKEGTVAPDGVWSGGSTYDADGIPTLFFTAGNYAHKGMISNQNVGIAYPKDINDPYLIEWEVDDTLAIEQKSGEGRSNEFRDMTVLKDGDNYYLIIGSGNENNNCGTALIYTTNTSKKDYFHHWEYKGHLFDYNNTDSKYGNVWELPVLLPLKNQYGNDFGKWVFMISPAPATSADNNVYYWVGTFNKETYRFTSDHVDPKRMDYGANVFTGPSGFIDPASGNTYIFSIMQSKRESVDLANSGWSHNLGLVRKVYYDTNNNDLGINFIDTTSLNDLSYVLNEPTNEKIEKLFSNSESTIYHADMYKLEAQVISNGGSFSIKCRLSDDKEEYTLIYYNGSNNTVGVNTQTNKNNAPTTGGDYQYTLKNNSSELLITLYVDRSQIEVLFNHEKTISARSYPLDLDSNGLEFSLSGNASISYLKFDTLKSIYEGK